MSDQPLEGGSQLDRPTRLLVSIGGYFGRSYTVSLQTSALRYQSFEEGAPLADELLVPTDRDWRAFLSALDSADVWGWLPDYQDPGTVDGTSWSIEISWGERSLVSQGANAFPTAFDDLLAAVSQLVGGRPFE
jgi:hypothetical protein